MNYIDLFAGAGGLSEGFIQAGYEPVAHIEMNSDATNTLKTRACYHYLRRKKELSSYYAYERGEISRDELYSLVPELELKRIINATIFMAKKPVSEGKTNTSNMQLNSQSFLGEMGYSVSKSRVVRQEILDKAMQEYGKRKVSDLIAFFIATREAQENGKQKYSNAIHIWQEDLNYISKA